VTLPLTPFPSPQAKPQGRGGTRCFRDASGSARTPSSKENSRENFLSLPPQAALPQGKSGETSGRGNCAGAAAPDPLIGFFGCALYLVG